MGIRSERTVYQLIEHHLKNNAEPLTCVDLMEFPDLRAAALEEFGDDIQHATNRVSDAMGFMWRRKMLTRYPAPLVNHTKARFAYSWADRSKPPPQSFPGKKPSFQIIESDNAVTIEFEHVTLTIRTR